MTLHFTNPGGRASPTDITTAVARALFMPFALVQDDPRGPSFRKNFASSDSDVVLYFTNPGAELHQQALRLL